MSKNGLQKNVRIIQKRQYTCINQDSPITIPSTNVKTSTNAVSQAATRQLHVRTPEGRFIVHAILGLNLTPVQNAATSH